MPYPLEAYVNMAGAVLVDGVFQEGYSPLVVTVEKGGWEGGVETLGKERE